MAADERALGFRLTELVAAISRATDLGTGQPLEHALQTCRPGVEVVRLIARGATNRAVATRSAISPQTVGRHVDRSYAQTSVTTRAGAALFAMEHGLLRGEVEAMG